MRTFFVDSEVADITIIGDYVEIEFEYETLPWAEEVEDTEQYTIYYGPVGDNIYLTKVVMPLNAIFGANIEIEVLDNATGEVLGLNEFVALLAEV